MPDGGQQQPTREEFLQIYSALTFDANAYGCSVSLANVLVCHIYGTALSKRIPKEDLGTSRTAQIVYCFCLQAQNQIMLKPNARKVSGRKGCNEGWVYNCKQLVALLCLRTQKVQTRGWTMWGAPIPCIYLFCEEGKYKMWVCLRYSFVECQEIYPDRQSRRIRNLLCVW